jgi:7,8-dihydropterin-6-yl-methyl-4-(beta-D-ribofuranosyl)aminobenzene 5'-phosphate synthase
MRVTVLADNCAGKGALKGESGLSMLIETGDRNYLFDTGLGKLFYANSRLMNLELFGVERIILSHGHYDHADGLPWAFRECDSADLIIHKRALDKKFSNSTGVLRYIGPNQKALNALHEADEAGRVIWMEGEVLEDAGNIIFSTGGRQNIPKKWNFFIEDENGKDIPDNFPDEISLLVQGQTCAALFVGCSHCGLPAIVEKAETLTELPIRYIFGGSHLDKVINGEIDEVAEFFLQRNCKLFLGHCTGINGYSRLYHALNARNLYPIQSGFTVDYDI